MFHRSLIFYPSPPTHAGFRTVYRTGGCVSQSVVCMSSAIAQRAVTVHCRGAIPSFDLARASVEHNMDGLLRTVRCVVRLYGCACVNVYQFMWLHSCRPSPLCAKSSALCVSADILLMIAWILLSTIVGFVTLCLVRLQDARELTRAQCARPSYPYSSSVSQQPQPDATGPGSAYFGARDESANAPFSLNNSYLSVYPLVGGAAPTSSVASPRTGYGGDEWTAGGSHLRGVEGGTWTPSDRQSLLARLVKSRGRGLQYRRYDQYYEYQE